jgi:hypothetical protein
MAFVLTTTVKKYYALLACEEGLQNMKQDSFLCLLQLKLTLHMPIPFSIKFIAIEYDGIF